MARNPIEIPIASETKAFRQGIESGVIDPLEDAEKALDDLGKSKGPEQLERDLKDAQKQTKELATETRDTARRIEREFEDSYRSVKQSSDDATGAAKKGMGEVRDEASSTAKESAASFDGSADSIVDAFQEIAANAFGGFGPAGMIAGLAAAAGIGLAMKGFEDVQAAQEKAEQSAADWATKFEESGQRVATAAQQAAGVIDYYTDPEKFKEAGEAAEKWGVDVDTAILALNGNVGAVQVVTDAVDRLRVASEEQGAAADKAAATARDGADAQRLALTPLESQYESATQRLAEMNDAQSEGARRADSISDSLKVLASQASEATEQVDDVGNRVLALPDGTEIFIDANTGRASLNLDRFKGDFDGKVRQMNGTEVAVSVRPWLDQAALDRTMATIRDRASRGAVTVAMNPRAGAQWQ